MKLSLQWLREFVPYRGAAQHLAELLSLSGTEVEAVQSLKRGLEQIIVGEVLTLVQHPHAERLKIAKVRVDADAAPTAIICGAPNIRPAQKVAVALAGVRLPNGETIEKRMIRGVASSGMICAPDELGLGADHAGILVVGSDVKVGTTLEKALGFDDTVLDLAITPNRPDCLSVLGIAREVSALTNTPLRWKAPRVPATKGKTPASRPALLRGGQGGPLKLAVRDRTACPQYSARLIRGVRVGESPQWLKNRLTAIGFRPVNTIVDITNYVMVELGQPLHAFDAKKVGSAIVVRRARKGERLSALDGKTYALDPSVLVIADAQKPIALAGLMGGAESEISNRTTTIILECALFHPKVVRKASQKLGLASESSYRFERGVDPAIGTRAADRAVALILALAGGKEIGSGMWIAQKTEKPIRVRTTAEDVGALLGVSTTELKTISIFRSLGFQPTAAKAQIEVTVPSWRPDVRLPVDLIEEVGRIIGYATLKPTLPAGLLAPRQLPPDADLQRDVRHRLALQGLTEIVTYSYLSGDVIRAAGGDPRRWLRIANPLSREQEYLRATLLPHLAQALSSNERFADDVALFEVGTTFLPAARGNLPHEEPHGAIGVSGNEAFRRVKGHVDALLAAVGVPAFTWVALDDRRAEVRSGSVVLGIVSVVPPSLAQFVKLRHEAAVAELSLPMLEKVRVRRSYAQPSPYQPVVRDVSCWLPSSVRFGDLAAAVRALNPLIADLDVFDVFQDAKDPSRRSVAFHVVFQPNDRTLRSDEVDAVIGTIASLIKERFGGEVRKS